jgi:sec-independent protein translocase protein TatC
MSPLFGDDEDGPEGDRPMTLAEHLDELRKRLVWAVAVAAVFVIGCMSIPGVEERILGIALWPAQSVLNEMPGSSFVSTEVSEKFFTAMKVDIVVGLFLAAPLILSILWGFFARGLHAHEKRYVRTYAPISYVLFLGGAAFFYFMLQPTFLRFLLLYHHDDLVGPDGRIIPVQMLPKLSETVSLFLSMTLYMGLFFEMPLVMLFLQAIRVCTWKTYWRHAKHFTLGLLVVAAVVTPTPDAFTLLLFMVPVLALFFGGILVCRMMAPADID